MWVLMGPLRLLEWNLVLRRRAHLFERVRWLRLQRELNFYFGVDLGQLLTLLSLIFVKVDHFVGGHAHLERMVQPDNNRSRD